MFDTAMFDKICSVKCSEGELKNFVRGLNRREFDMDNAFDKYYRVETVIKCIELYKSGEISDRIFAYWACAYNWIVMEGFKGKDNDENEKDVSLKTVIRWEISDWLDSLSFCDSYDKSEFLLDIDDYAYALRMMDSLYKNADDLRAFYSYTYMKYDDGEDFGDIYILLINDKSREFIIFENDFCDFRKCTLHATLCEEEILNQTMRDLGNAGYKEIKLGREFDM